MPLLFPFGPVEEANTYIIEGFQPPHDHVTKQNSEAVELLKKAKAYEELKIRVIKAVADALDISLEEVFAKT